MKDIYIDYRAHSWYLTVTHNDDSKEEFVYGGDVPLDRAVAETRALVSLKEKNEKPRESHKLPNFGPSAIAELENKLKPKEA